LIAKKTGWPALLQGISRCGGRAFRATARAEMQERCDAEPDMPALSQNNFSSSAHNRPPAIYVSGQSFTEIGLWIMSAALYSETGRLAASGGRLSTADDGRIRRRGVVAAAV
jgi:hypothetical protein